MDEKKAFSSRLKQQLAQRGWVINSPTWLSKEFNLRYGGQPISVQTASNWLSGTSIPNQDKLQVLAAWLDISSQWLRFGETFEQEQENRESTLYPNMHFQVNDLLDKISLLSAHQKYLIYMLVNELLENKTDASS